MFDHDRAQYSDSFDNEILHFKCYKLSLYFCGARVARQVDGIPSPLWTSTNFLATSLCVGVCYTAHSI
jgi:hypothetical protein